MQRAINSKIYISSPNISYCLSVINDTDAYAGRIVATFTENNSDNYSQFIVNEIASGETKKTSKPAITKVGL